MWPNRLTAIVRSYSVRLLQPCLLPKLDRLIDFEEADDALGPAGPGHVLGWRKAGLVSLDGVAPDLGGSSKSEK